MRSSKSASESAHPNFINLVSHNRQTGRLGLGRSAIVLSLGFLQLLSTASHTLAGECTHMKAGLNTRRERAPTMVTNSLYEVQQMLCKMGLSLQRKITCWVLNRFSRYIPISPSQDDTQPTRVSFVQDLERPYKFYQLPLLLR